MYIYVSLYKYKYKYIDTYTSTPGLCTVRPGMPGPGPSPLDSRLGPVPCAIQSGFEECRKSLQDPQPI